MALDVHPGLHPLVDGHEVRCWLYHDATGRLVQRPPGWVPRTDVPAEEVLTTGSASDHGLAAGTAVEADTAGILRDANDPHHHDPFGPEPHEPHQPPVRRP
jgi:hypothetical protein